VALKLPRRIGVAVGIPEPWGSQLDEHRAASGDPMADLIPAHLTLLGPTDLDEAPEVWADTEAHLTRVAGAHRPFQVQLRGTGTFRPITQVVFVAVAAGGSECEELAGDIRSGPLRRELLYPYHPHITVAHDVATEALDAAQARLTAFEARFAIDGFTLYEQGEGGRWSPQRRFPLSESLLVG
jgi:2'-5' RNA ligase